MHLFQVIGKIQFIWFTCIYNFSPKNAHVQCQPSYYETVQVVSQNCLCLKSTGSKGNKKMRNPQIYISKKFNIGRYLKILFAKQNLE